MPCTTTAAATTTTNNNNNNNTDYSMVSLVPSDNRRHLLTFSYYDNGLMWDISTTPTDQQRPGTRCFLFVFVLFFFLVSS